MCYESLQVKSSFDDWNTTLWCDINVEQMEMDCKKFVKVGVVVMQELCACTYVELHVAAPDRKFYCVFHCIQCMTEAAINPLHFIYKPCP